MGPTRFTDIPQKDALLKNALRTYPGLKHDDNSTSYYSFYYVLYF